ncbi:hypothetical protein SAMN05877753_104317 [Bacillus oleivorans]|uniref:Uncharacterized protein n=1 Tax=Bacillus oleivorans TaxID=1448271 RepID=A0A285CUM3_9BACI|nr:hypothetical protein [Bacillus oleivorans]SNX70748.1 hypothetical protein SAMN05877753_104317 [Bacillus oleivorans]
MPVNDQHNHKIVTDSKERPTTGDYAQQRKENNNEELIHSEKIRYKNADEIYE